MNKKIDTLLTAFLHFQAGGMNITAYLAQQGNNVQVENILARGGCYYDAIYGYALSGNLIKIKELQELNATTEYKAVIRGLAAGGHFELLHTLPYAKDYPAEQVYGFALAGEKNKVLSLLQKHGELLAVAIQGYATGNHEVLLQKLLPGTPHHALAIDYAARAGHTQLVTQLLRNYGVSSLSLKSYSSTNMSMATHNTFLLLNRAAMSYVLGGHYQESAALLELGANATQCLAALSDFSGAFKPQLALVLLAHIQNQETREHMIAQIKLYADGADVALPQTDFEYNEVIMQLMHDEKINYIEAEAATQGTSSGYKKTVSLAYLTDILAHEPLVELHCDTKCSIRSN